MAAFDLLVLGDANPDVVVHGAPGNLTFGQAERMVEDAGLTLGGSGALMASAAARLGLSTAFVGVVGADPGGDLVLAMLTDAGVDVSGVTRDRFTATALSVVLVCRDGDRAILTSAGTLPSFGPEHVDPGLLARARHVHVTSVFLQPKLLAALPDLLGAARSGGASTSMDTNDDPTGRWALDLGRVLPVVDYLLPNEREVEGLASGGSGHTDARHAARTLADHGPCVVVKCGPAGAFAVPAGGGTVITALSPASAVQVVDSVGAGDAFDAGLVAGLSQGVGLRGALRLAVAVGTLSLRVTGGRDGQPGPGEAADLARHVVVEDEE